MKLRCKTKMYIPSVDGNWGGVVDETNNTYNGMIGMLQRKEADTAIGSITITVPRWSVVDFSISYYETAAGFIAHYPRELSKRAALLRPYKTAVWVALSVLLILSGSVGYWISRKSRKPKIVKLSLLKCYEFCYRITLLQDMRTDKLRYSIAVHVYLVFWIVFGFIIVSAYNSSLISSLTIPVLAKPLETFKDVLNASPNLDIMTEESTAMQQLMSTSSNQIFRSIQAISDRTGFNVNPDIETSIETVLNYPNKVHFSDLAYFIVKIFPPGGNDLRVSNDIYLEKRVSYLQVMDSHFSKDLSFKMMSINKHVEEP